MNLKSIKRKELLRFLVGGGSAVVVDYICYNFFLYFEWNMAFAKATSYICGALCGFIINKFWTFESKKFRKDEVVKYIVLYAISAGVNAFVNKIVFFVIGIKLFAFLCATGVSTIMNFMGQKFFVFNKGENKE